ncbi:MAG: hypothetical protein M3Y07_12985 [Acidobacteriota bacterium]|nr:hypothetical protein [Acidobacteriota bacterium]
MIAVGLLLLFAAPENQTARLVRMIALSGRVVEQGVSESDRVTPPPTIAPGPPPILQFRYLEGSFRHRFGDSALVLDDAGH